MDTFTLDKIEFDGVRAILAGHCLTRLGKSLVEQIVPAAELAQAQSTLADTEEMLRCICEVGLPPLAGATGISETLKRVRPGGGGDGGDFANIASCLEAAGQVSVFINELDDSYTRLKSMVRELGPFTSLIETIRRAIASDGSVRDDASPQLSRLRREIARVSDDINDSIHGYLRNPDVRKLLTNPTVTIHGDRYVLPVRADHRGRLPGVVHRVSNTGGTVFVEPNASVQLNNHLVDLRDHERMEIERLLTELGANVLHHERAIRHAVKALGEIDLMTAKAQYAYRIEGAFPELTEDGPVRLFSARHPLLLAEKPDATVPIDVRLGMDADILVITGSNTGGKTVTLKTVALLAAMAQTGLFIPAAEGATLPLFKNILIDIGDEQSLQQSLSTFGGHIQRLKAILAQAGKLKRNVLVLLDELGSGTDPDEGGAIGAAVLDELRRLGCLAMVSTHLSILKAYALDHDRVDNASVEFDTATLRPTYHLHLGQAGQSHAITVAEKLGLPSRVIDGARKHLGRRGSQFRKALRKTGRARQEAEAAMADAHAAETKAQKKQAQLTEKMSDVRQLRQDWLDWLTTLTDMKKGDKIFVPTANAFGTLQRLEFHHQKAVIDMGTLQMEVPFTELMPELGQKQLRKELAGKRRQRELQSQDIEAKLREAETLKKQAAQLKRREEEKAKRFDRWMTMISRVKIGEEVTLQPKPGTGVLKELDFKGLRAVVEVAKGKTITVSLQDLFPQTGPNAPDARKHKKQAQKRRHEKKLDQPVHHVNPAGKKAKADRKAVLATRPGEEIYVAPFRSRATLIRIDEKKDIAVVSRGAFEMQVALSDCQPVGYPK